MQKSAGIDTQERLWPSKQLVEVPALGTIR